MIEQLNANIDYQFFCDIHLGHHRLTNYKIVSQIRCELAKNLSIEKYGTCDSLDFQIRNRCWGFVEEFSGQNKVVLYDTCFNNINNPLLVGDFLFVSKANYGMRMPMTIAMIPLLHNRVPIVGGESYLKKPNLQCS